jgi:hypothetical protein
MGKVDVHSIAVETVLAGDGLPIGSPLVLPFSVSEDLVMSQKKPVMFW